MASMQDLLDALKSIEQSLSQTGVGGEEGAAGPTLTRREEERRADYLTQEQKALEDIEKAYKSIGKQHALDLDYQNQKIKRLNNQAQILREDIRALMQEGAETSKKDFEALEQKVYKMEKEAEIWKVINREAKQYEATIEEAASAASAMGESLGSTLHILGGTQMTDGIKSVTKAFQGGKASVAAFGLSLGVAVGEAMINNMANLVIQAYNTEKAFRAATGGSQEMARGVTSLYEDTRALGVTLEEANRVTQDLFTTYTDFTMISATQREDLAKTAATLEQLGVATQDFAKGVQVATKMLGVTAGAVDETMLELRAHAVDLGIAPSQMAADFAGAGSSLAKFGKDGVKAFKDVALASKITGMEIPKILSLVEKFDTFEGAAKQAGQLNAALGGNFVNAMDLMMETDPAARFNMIRDAILDTGLTFDNMSYYQKKFYTEAAGLSEVGDLALMLSGNMEALDENIGKTSEDYEKAAEQAKAFQDIQSQLKSLMADMIPVIEPLINLLGKFAGWLSENTGVAKAFAAAITGLAVAMGFLAVASLPITGPMLAIGAAIAGVVGAVVWLSDTLFSDDVGASTFLEGLHKIALAFKEIGSVVVDFMLLPLKTLMGAMSKIGDFIGPILGGPTATDTTRAQTLQAATTQAAAAPAAAAATTARMGPQAQAQSEKARTAAAGTTERPYNVNITLELDGDVLEKKQLQFLGGRIRNAVLTG